MSSEAKFLISLGQALSAMGLYAANHPARQRAIESSFARLLPLLAHEPSVEFSFLADEPIVGHRSMPELPRWEWATRLSAAGVERVEIDAEVSEETYGGFLEDVWARLSGELPTTSEARQLLRTTIRFGGLRLAQTAPGAAPSSVEANRESSGPVRLDEEVRTVAWIHAEVGADRVVPLLAAETVAISLSATMHAQRGLVLPLLTLKEYDQYTLTHSCNVAVLSIGLAERLGLGGTIARRFGVAGLLHDIGKVRIPHDLLVKPGRYTEQERDVIQRHPVEGARIIFEQPNGSEVAAVVAYEHHIFLDGLGYPTLQFPRSCHYASRIVHVCDIYDALCTERPYRKAWSPDEAAAYIEQKAGTELDPAIAAAFGSMIREADVQRLPLSPKKADEPSPRSEAR